MEEAFVGIRSYIGRSLRHVARVGAAAALVISAVPLLPATPVTALVNVTAASTPCPTSTPCLEVLNPFVREGSAAFVRVHTPITSPVMQQFVYRAQPLDGTNGTVARMYTATAGQVSFAREPVEVSPNTSSR